MHYLTRWPKAVIRVIACVNRNRCALCAPYGCMLARGCLFSRLHVLSRKVVYSLTHTYCGFSLRAYGEHFLYSLDHTLSHLFCFRLPSSLGLLSMLFKLEASGQKKISFAFTNDIIQPNITGICKVL